MRHFSYIHNILESISCEWNNYSMVTVLSQIVIVIEFGAHQKTTLFLNSFKYSLLFIYCLFEFLRLWCSLKVNSTWLQVSHYHLTPTSEAIIHTSTKHSHQRARTYMAYILMLRLVSLQQHPIICSVHYWRCSLEIVVEKVAEDKPEKRRWEKYILEIKSKYFIFHNIQKCFLFFLRKIAIPSSSSTLEVRNVTRSFFSDVVYVKEVFFSWRTDAKSCK